MEVNTKIFHIEIITQIWDSKAKAVLSIGTGEIAKN